MSATSLHSEQVTDLQIGVRCGETSAYRAEPDGIPGTKDDLSSNDLAPRASR
jgi:hypothetical protein